MDNKFGGVIWTNHAILRLNERHIRQSDAWATLKHPDRSRFAETKNAWIYNRTFGRQAVEVVARQNEQKEWIVLSVWSRPIDSLPNYYLVRNRYIDWVLDSLIALFSRLKRHGQ